MIADQDHVDGDDRRRRPIYAEFFEPMELAFNCQTVLVHEHDLLLRASVTRTRSQGPLESEDFLAFAALAPDLLAAARLELAIGRTRLNGILESLEATGAAAFLINERGQLAAASAAGEAMALDGACLTIRGRRLHAAVEADAARLADAIASALAAARGELGKATLSLVLRHRSAVGGQVFDVHPLAYERRGLGGPAVLVVSRNRVRRSEAEILQTLYALSASEAAVAAMIGEGAAPEEIAAARGVGRSTIKSQMKAVFAKTGVNRQNQLVRLLRDLA